MIQPIINITSIALRARLESEAKPHIDTAVNKYVHHIKEPKYKH